MTTLSELLITFMAVSRKGASTGSQPPSFTVVDRRDPEKKSLTFDGTVTKTDFRLAKVTEQDLHIFRDFDIKTWNGERFEEDSLLRHGYWVVNAERDVILKPLGGGACEIPEMYALLYKGDKIHIEGGGGGTRALISENRKDHGNDWKFRVTRLVIPKNLLPLKDEIMATIAEALAVECRLMKLTVIFPSR